jgi:trehalose/maltose hydrolase-like predicted phosphorylase
MGPDEFHEKYPASDKPGLNDNAYTNFMIVWTLLRAQEVLNILSQKRREELEKRLGIGQREVSLWKDITKKMNIIISPKGIIEQFKGYFDLKEINWKHYKDKYGDIHRMDRILKAEGKSPDAYKVSKQADVLMIFYLFSLPEIKEIFYRLGYKFNRGMIKENFDYYHCRTSHGSSLSNVVHCFIAHLLGQKQKAWQWFKKVLDTDIHDIQGGTTPEGIHTGTMGGSLNIVMECFAGLNFVKDKVMINPHLPKQWDKIKFSILYRKVWINLEITKKQIILFLIPKAKRQAVQPVYVQGKEYIPKFGKKIKIPLSKG